MRTDTKIASLDALRGLLALWVLIAHVVARVISDNGVASVHGRAAVEPLLPVYVFMILSGFVIFALLDREGPNFFPFIIRRFFRLAPLYFVVLLAASLLVKFELHVLDDLFWRNAHIYDSIKIHHETLDQFWPNFWAHALMVQGLVSDHILPDANFTFFSQGWSISLEWQFYLLAPLLFLLLRRRHALGLALVALALAALASYDYASVGFLPNQLGWFALGIFSYYAWRHCSWYAHLDARRHDAVLLAIAAALFFVLKEPIPVLAWLVVLDTLIAQRMGLKTPMTSALAWVLDRPLLQRLGDISYSVYLLHMPILYIVFRAISRTWPHMFGWRFLALALPLTLLATLLAALATHRWIEKPGIALGRRLARRRPAASQLAAAE